NQQRHQRKSLSEFQHNPRVESAPEFHKPGLLSFSRAGDQRCRGAHDGPYTQQRCSERRSSGPAGLPRHCASVEVRPPLSPSEKLQLVQDLWDDLAAAPEAVPVHAWQEQELARRKANLLKNPASGLDWEDVKRKVRARYTP